MARNLDRNYLKKLLAIETPNGFKFDLGNYVSNPSYDHEYPTFRKVIAKDDDAIVFEEVGYFKYYDGTGEYRRKTYSVPNNGETWSIVKELSKEVLAESNRFNLKTLVSYC